MTAAMGVGMVVVRLPEPARDRVWLGWAAGLVVSVTLLTRDARRRHGTEG